MNSIVDIKILGVYRVFGVGVRVLCVFFVIFLVKF